MASPRNHGERSPTTGSRFHHGTTPDDGEAVPPEDGDPTIIDPPSSGLKLYYDGGHVEILGHIVHELDPNGKQLRVVEYTDYAAESVPLDCTLIG